MPHAVWLEIPCNQHQGILDVEVGGQAGGAQHQGIASQGAAQGRLAKL